MDTSRAVTKIIVLSPEDEALGVRSFGQETVVTDAVESVGQAVEQEAATRCGRLLSRP